MLGVQCSDHHDLVATPLHFTRVLNLASSFEDCYADVVESFSIAYVVRSGHIYKHFDDHCVVHVS